CNMELATITDIVGSAVKACCATEVNLLSASARLLLSVALGCIVGYERKSRGQIAGVGTFALISAGAALAMLLSIYIPQVYIGLKNGDPGRIAAQVITGIGFLGAGAIIRMKGTIKGLTTAAGIWLMAMIGMAVGAGLYLVGIVATLLMVGVLTGVSDYEQRVNIGWKTKTLRIELRGIDFSLSDITNELNNHNVRVVDTFLKQDFERQTTVVNMVTLVKSNLDMRALFAALRKFNNIKTVSFDSDFNL
ncbi:MAG: MgtC/SapB family protein, partial [Candidatus Limisoma sp.]